MFMFLYSTVPLSSYSFLLRSLLCPPLFNHCLNLHARISPLIANPVFSLFLWPSHFPSLPHLWWCRLTALSETWDVYRWTVRVTAQRRVCVCVCWGLRALGGFLLEWPYYHQDSFRPFPDMCRSVCVSVSAEIPCVCARVCQPQQILSFLPVTYTKLRHAS